jgi:hypothetical protein
MTREPKRIEPALTHVNRLVGGDHPLFERGPAVTILNVDPGSYASWTARLRRTVLLEASPIEVSD